MTTSGTPDDWLINGIRVSSDIGEVLPDGRLVVYDPACGLSQTSLSVVECRDAGAVLILFIVFVDRKFIHDP